MTTEEKRKEQKEAERTKAMRVDFTPMVDMNMLLLTFFMLASSLSQPQTMDISMPSRVTSQEQMTKVHPDKAITIVLGEDNRVFYYEGEPNFEDYTSFKETDYTANGLRSLLLRRNANIIREIEKLKQDRIEKRITEEEFKELASEAKKASDAIVVSIKPMPNSSYLNMIDALDEMLICNVGKYAIVDYTDAEEFLFLNLETKGQAREQSR